MKTILKIVRWILTIFLCVVLLVVVLQKFTKNRIALGNVYVFQVATGSMIPVYEVGDIIVVRKTKVSDLKVGDDITYRGDAAEFKNFTITHRIVDKRYENGRYYFTTKGVANTEKDPEISETNIYGKVIYHTILFSFVGRLMTNALIYYLLFIVVGVSFSYEILAPIILKGDGKKDE